MLWARQRIPAALVSDHTTIQHVPIRCICTLPVAITRSDHPLSFSILYSCLLSQPGPPTRILDIWKIGYDAHLMHSFATHRAFARTPHYHSSKCYPRSLSSHLAFDFLPPVFVSIVLSLLVLSTNSIHLSQLSPHSSFNPSLYASFLYLPSLQFGCPFIAFPVSFLGFTRCTH